MGKIQMSDPAMTAMARRPFPALLPTLGFIVFYFALQGLCTAIIIAATQETSTTPEPISIIWGLLASAMIQLSLMGHYLRKDGRVEALGLHDFGRIPLHKASGLAILCVAAAMAFNFVYATYVIPGVDMQADGKNPGCYSPNSAEYGRHVPRHRHCCAGGRRTAVSRLVTKCTDEICACLGRDYIIVFPVRIGAFATLCDPRPHVAEHCLWLSISPHRVAAH